MPDGGLPGGDSPLASVREALEGLGYAATEIRDAVSDLDVSESVEDLLLTALQRLGRS